MKDQKPFSYSLIKYLKSFALILMVFCLCNAIDSPWTTSIIDWINRLDKNDELPGEASFKLIEIGKPAVKSLVYAFKHKNANIRQAIPFILVQINGVDSLPMLLEALKDKNSGVVRAAERAISSIGEDNIEIVFRLLKSADQRIKKSAALILAKMIIDKEQGNIGMDHRYNDNRPVKPLMTILNDNDDPDIKIHALCSLGKLNDPTAAPVVIPFLEDKNLIVRIDAIQALGNMKAEQAAAPLIRKLNDENWQIRMESASALGNTHDKSAVPPLISLLSEHDWRVKYRAIIALGKLRDSRAIDPLIGLFRKDNDILIKRVVVYSLGEISNSKAVDFLYRAFNDEDDLIKPGVITALEKIGKPSLNVLVKLLKTHDENHYHYLDEILETIGNIGDTRVAAPLIEFIETHDSSSARRFAFIALGKFKDKRSFNLCIDALNDTDNLVKRSALYALSELADPRSLDAIKKVMDTDPVRFIRENARSVLNKIKDELKKKGKSEVNK